jgi:hypothetical protein
MYGTQMGVLNVLTGTPHLQHINNIWQKSGNQGQGWNMANISIDISHPVKVRFYQYIKKKSGRIAQVVERRPLDREVRG